MRSLSDPRAGANTSRNQCVTAEHLLRSTPTFDRSVAALPVK
jgi:hypothetical protein